MPFSSNFTTTSPSHALIKTFFHFHKQLTIAPRKPVFCNYDYEYKAISLQASFSMLITLLFHLILNFHSMILAFNICSVFNLITLIYMKCYANLSRRLTNHINQHRSFLFWFFNCFYLCQVFKVAWVINQKNFTSATKFLFLTSLISVKFLQSTKFKVKCYRFFINLEFCESIRIIQVGEYLSLNN